MKRNTFLTAALTALTLLAAAFTVSAASPDAYNPGGDEYEADSSAPYVPAIIKLDTDDQLTSLIEEGGILLRRRGDLALMFLPREKTSSLIKRAPGEKDKVSDTTPRIQPGRRVAPAMDKAREWYGASRILTGEGLPKAYDGKGVVAGICDIGFDPSHSTFRDPESGISRVKRITQYKEAQGLRIELNGEDEYREWRTDTLDHYHGTHVAGILTGSDNSVEYGGIASGADIVISTSQLSDVGLLAGVEDIIEYAKEVGKPAVINLSMGGYVGPHDGTSLFSQYMDMLGEEAIICMSAGNEGAPHHTNSLSYVFTPESKIIGQRIHNYKWTQFDIEGMIDIWSADARPLTITPLVFDETTRQTVYTFPSLRPLNAESWSVTTEEAKDGMEAADEEFRRYFNGWFTVIGEVNPDNGRYNVSLLYDLHTETQSADGAWARYNIGFNVEGVPGQRIDIFADGQYSRLREMPGSPAPGSSFSVSDLATGDNVICVGMYNSRGSWPLLSGEEDTQNLEPGTVHKSSSFGTLLDGRVLPHTVAPGNPIVSAYSGPYLEKYPQEFTRVAAKSYYDDKTHYWGIEGGTSMSSPYVAGFVAILLEADPTLSVADIKRLIAETNRHDMTDPDDPRHGQGWFDPYAIMTRVVSNLSVPGNIDSNIKAEIANGILYVQNPDATPLTLTISDTAGRTLLSTYDSSTLLTLPLNNWRGNILLIHLQPATAPARTLKATL